MSRYWIETYGCQMNKAESAALEREMTEAGWMPAAGAEDADLVILNTCSVRETAEERIWGRIGRYKSLKKKHRFTLVVMGCMAERLKEDIRTEAPAVDLVVGTFQKESFLRRLQTARSEIASARLDETGGYKFSARHAMEGDYKAFVPIMHGCDNFCSYCIVPYVRGREVSRDPEMIFAELEELFSRGVREITLLGQNVNSYKYSSGGSVLDFPGLLRALLHRFPDVPWIRFLTSHPKDFSDRLIETMAGNRALCRHIHLPVQHGSDSILAAMNRKYTREDYIRLVGRIRSAVPDVSLGTDILIGFPGETETDFRLTLELMKEVRFDDAFTYYYNPRKGTKAYDMPDTVPEDLKLERLAAIIDLQREITRDRKKERLGNGAVVLVEGVSKKKDGELLSRTERDEMVVFPGPRDLIGNFAEVRLAELRGNTFVGERVV